MAVNDLLEALAEENPEAIFFTGLEEAIVGVARQWSKKPLVVYGAERIIRVFMEREGMSREDAEEWFSFNVQCLWAGEGTPLILETVDT